MLDGKFGLMLWRSVTMEGVRGAEPDLSARQMAILTTVYLTPAPHTVRALAESLLVTKPAITRAVDTLCALDLVRRRRDPEDRRNVLVQRTHAGSAFLATFGDRIERAARALA